MKKLRRKDKNIIGWFLLVCALLAGSIVWAWHEYVSTPPYVDPDRFPVRGFDISAHNGYANLKAAADAGFEFVFIKASEGVDFRDPNFALNWQKARHAGLAIGAYHFFRFDKDGVEQADNFLRVIGPRPLDLPLVIDVEETGNPAGIPLEKITERLQQMMEYLNMRGHRVMLYSNRAGYEKLLYDDFRGYDLWICQFTDNSANSDWTFWQFDHHGHVPGIRGEVDLDVYHGSRHEWEQWIK